MEYDHSIGELLGFEYVSTAGGADAKTNDELYKQELEYENLKAEQKEKKEVKI